MIVQFVGGAYDGMGWDYDEIVKTSFLTSRPGGVDRPRILLAMPSLDDYKRILAGEITKEQARMLPYAYERVALADGNFEFHEVKSKAV